MKRFFIFLCISLIQLLSVILSAPTYNCHAHDEPFITPSNSGGTGLMETPTARMLNENEFRAGASQIHPYRYYYIAISPYKNLEIEGHVTEVIGVKALEAGYGNTRDKAFGIKYKIIKEEKYAPAVTIGIIDPHGTRIYPSQYIVASKQIYPFDFSLGFGNGRFGKKPLPKSDESFEIEMFNDTRGWLKDSQFFGGIQFAPSEKLAFMIEYSPILYNRQTRDPAQAKYFTEPVKSRLNYGLRLKPWKWANIDLSYQRGDTVGINLSVAFDYGQETIPIYDKIYKETQADRAGMLNERLINALGGSGFSNIGIDIQDNNLLIEAQNDRYYYSTRAIGVILQILNDITPPDINNINIVLTENLIPVMDYKTTRLDITELYKGKMTTNEFFYLSKMETDIPEAPDIKLERRKYFDYGFRPAFSVFLNDPSGFFKYRLGVELWGSYSPWKGGSFIASFEGYPLNTVSTSNEPLSNVVRSDIVQYQQNKVLLGKLLYNHIFKIKHNVYGKLAAGLLETEYAGIDGEVAMPLGKGRFMVGLSSSVVKKRDVDNALKLSSQYTETYKTAFFNARMNIPEIETTVDVKAGRFLAGDNGTRLTIKKFVKGIVLGGWYSWTNTSMFTDKHNKGYHDKGVMLTLPLRLFTGSDSKTSFDYKLSPWTRDVAQDIDHHTVLFDMFGRNTKIYLDKDKAFLYK